MLDPSANPSRLMGVPNLLRVMAMLDLSRPKRMWNPLRW